MKFKPPSERTQTILISPLLIVTAPAWIVLIGLLAAMVAFDDWNNARLERRGWRSWFAWHPAEIDTPWSEPTRYAWLEIVERKRFRNSWGYRAPVPTQPPSA